MQNHYKTLGLTNAASLTEIRRAYRILARRYHPDVNPSVGGDEIFKEIAIAYAILSDAEKRRQYDIELKQSTESFEESFKRAHETLKRNQRASAYRSYQGTKSAQQGSSSGKTTKKTNKSRITPSANRQVKKPLINLNTVGKLSSAPKLAMRVLHKGLSLIRKKAGGVDPDLNAVTQFSLLEVSISIQDAIQGVRKSVELGYGAEQSRKVAIPIPPGVRTGSIVRYRRIDESREEIVLVIRVENHPWLSIGERGLTMEVPLTISEAIQGAKIQVPSLSDPLLVTVERNTQSGKEVRLKGQGITNRDGTRGDLYLRFLVALPQVDLNQDLLKIDETLALLYKTSVREHLPSRILQASDV